VSKLPRKAPDEVTEHRITFGNYERQFVTEIKNDIETAAKIASISAVALPIATVAGLGLLGYGLLKGGQSIGKGLNEFSMMDWTVPDVLQDIKDSWTGIKWGIDPRPKEGETPTPTLEEMEYATKDYSWIQKQELWLWIISGGKLGKSHEQLRAENEQGGDF